MNIRSELADDEYHVTIALCSVSPRIQRQIQLCEVISEEVCQLERAY